jgi:hypothetical protein
MSNKTGKSFYYISADLFKDERIKSIDDDRTRRDQIILFWQELIACAAKTSERKNLKNCVARLDKKTQYYPPEFIELSIKRLDELNLLSIDAIKNIVKFKE